MLKRLKQKPLLSILPSVISPSPSLGLVSRPSYSYISPIDKPILSLSLASLHQLSAQCMAFLTMDGGLSSEMSVLVGAMLFRIGIQGIGTIVRGWRFWNRGKSVKGGSTVEEYRQRDYVQQRYRQSDRQIIKWIDRILILDTVRDMQFYGIPKQQINQAIWQYYHPRVLLSSAINSYLCLNFLRGAYTVTNTPQYAQFCDQTVYLTNLGVCDWRFLLPIGVMIGNYFLIRGSRHPFFIHMTQKSHRIYCTNLAFMSGLIFVPIPGIYGFAYMGLVAGHLIIRALRYKAQNIGKYTKKFFNTK